MLTYSFMFVVCYSWLNRLGLAAYVDNFAEQGYSNMFELQEFTFEVR